MELSNYEKEHLQILRRHLAECMVLLKHNGDFPLERAGKIALFGSGARNTIKGGTGSGEVNSRYFVTIEEGMEKAGFTITTKQWLDDYDQIYKEAYKEFIKEIKSRAKANHTMAVLEGMGAVMREPNYELPLEGEGEAAVYVLSRISGEGNDRNPVGGDILLTDTEQRDILKLKEKYQKFILVLNVGGPIDLSPVMAVQNILLISQLGVETGTALADALLGETNPSGKLATTWSAWKDNPSIGEFGNIDNTRYQEGIYVGYRYFDSIGKKALFPFGYGLSYTTFESKVLDVSCMGEKITVNALVKNTGKFAGKEVVELYVSVPEGKLDQPYQTLAGWAKTKELAPQESEQVTVEFALSEIASYDTEYARYVLERGDYVLHIGNNSVETEVCAVISLNDEAVLAKLHNCGGTTDFTDWKPEQKREPKIPSDIKRLEIKALDIKQETVSYELSHEIDEAVEKLSDEQLAYLNVGAFNPKGGILSIIGNASMSVAGAAGESAGILEKEGFPIMVMADGPAGVRIAQKYFRDEKGLHAVGVTIPASIVEFLPGPAKWFMKVTEKKPKKDTEVHTQYTTALPIGTAIAQSWNLEFAKCCGDIIGNEMKRMGIHLWLAPALNIHRSIQCGRNFEYYSEDPLISGRIAAATTEGLQSHQGCGVTIKHYAANNQETNRYNNNSCVSERALREIYLRGFEICVKEANPHALMTSYNLLNGEHTSESRDLIENILRCEWGYQGIVMTDWLVAEEAMSKNAQYPAAKAGKIAAAGGDLVMPGGKNNVADILKRLETGELDRKQLQINVTRVYRMAKKLQR